MYKYLILITTLSSCAPQNEAEFVSLAPELATHWDSFVREASNRERPIKTSNVVIKFGDLNKPSTAAICEYKSTPTITFSTKYYNYFMQTGQPHLVEHVMYHELGHCILGKHHNDNGLRIMNTFVMSQSTYLQNKEALLDDLFN